MEQHVALLAIQGAIVDGYRTRRGQRLGPYAFLAFRDNGRQRRIYLGTDEQLVAEVRVLLDDLQQPLRQQRFLARQKKIVCKEFAAHKEKSRETLAKVRLRYHGNDIRGLLCAVDLSGNASSPNTDVHVHGNDHAQHQPT